MALDHGGTDYSGLVGQSLAGGLRVTQRTGSSPHGPLYEAEDLEGRRVALLILPAVGPGREPEGVRSFRQATKIRHPNVAAVQAVGELEDGSVYVVLEEATGEPLEHLLAERVTYPIGEALELILQLVTGLEALHNAGFFHGNVSPSTMVVTRQPFGKSQIKLIGFSLHTDPERSTGLQADGTPYASPERRAGSPPDTRGDVYSVGAVLHHMLGGAPPIDGQLENVPRVARPVLKRALAHAPGDRFRRMSELREALEALAATALTPPDAVAYRKILSRAIVAGLVLVTAGVLLTPVWKTMGESRAPAVAAPAAPTSPDTSGEQRRSTVAGRTAPVPRARAATKPAGGEPSRRRQSDERTEAPEAAGYVGQGPGTEASAETVARTPPPQRAGPSAPAATRPVPADPPKPRARPRSELEQYPPLRLAMGDVTRVGLAEDVVEAEPGLLVVKLAPGGMNVPSTQYNLQRLYLAYSAATKQPDTVALELRLNGKLYGWFTRGGLRSASPGGNQP